MPKWYLLSIVALLLMGTQRFLYKVSAERGCNTVWTTLVFMATVALLSTVFFVAGSEVVSDIPYLLLVALVNAGAFLAATVTHIEALKRVPATIVYPLIRLDIVLVVLFSVSYFHDRLSAWQIMGIIIALLVIVVLAAEAHEQGPSYKDLKGGFMLMGIAVLSGALAAISSKFAALYTSPLGFMAISYLMATIFSFLLKTRRQGDNAGTNRRDAVVIGLVMGIANFLGFYAYLKALACGPLSLIAPITGMHFTIAIIFSVLIYKERLTPSRILGIALAILSMVLLRL